MSRIIIQNGNMKDNIPGWPYYHVSRDGKVYSRKSGNWKLLRWGTQKQNMEDARKNGKLRGSSCKASRAKLSKKDLILIFKLKAKGLYYKDIAKRLGVSVGTIGRVINKKFYRDENIDRKR